MPPGSWLRRLPQGDMGGAWVNFGRSRGGAQRDRTPAELPVGAQTAANRAHLAASTTIRFWVHFGMRLSLRELAATQMS